jgi:hypothetical protein
MKKEPVFIFALSPFTKPRMLALNEPAESCFKGMLWWKGFRLVRGIIPESRYFEFSLNDFRPSL